MLKDELDGDRARDLSLNVFEVSSGEIGAAIAPVRRAETQRGNFILLMVCTVEGRNAVYVNMRVVPLCGHGI